MLFLNFARIFKLKGIHKPFSHLVNSGYSEGFATRMSSNKVMEINCRRLEKFCTDYNITPNDLFDFHPTTKNYLPQDHILHTLTKKGIDLTLLEKIDSLSPEKLKQVHDILQNMQ